MLLALSHRYGLCCTIEAAGLRLLLFSRWPYMVMVLMHQEHIFHVDGIAQGQTHNEAAGNEHM